MNKIYFEPNKIVQLNCLLSEIKNLVPRQQKNIHEEDLVYRNILCENEIALHLVKHNKFLNGVMRGEYRYRLSLCVQFKIVGRTGSCFYKKKVYKSISTGSGSYCVSYYYVPRTRS